MTPAISPAELRQYVIKPALAAINMGGDDIEVLLLRTAMQESDVGAHLVQLGGGPARGIWQMEVATHDDLWKNFIGFRQPLFDAITRLLIPGIAKSDQLAGNLYYACAMARVQFFRSPRPIPPASDLEAQAELYKLVYNGPGAATTDQFITNAKQLGI